MSCATVEPELIAFHFATLDDATRGEVEEHLPTCGQCLKSYLALKRHLEMAESEPAPSPASRSRLRAAVSEHLNPAARPWQWWERPLAFGFASAALVMAIVMTHAVSVSPGSAPKALSSHGPR